MADDELLFPVRRRGDNRDALLDDLRWGLRQMRDPKTGAVFTDDQIAIATAPHSSAYIKADGVDAVTFLQQQRALWMAAQGRPDVAAGVTLQGEYAPLWDLPYLKAAGGSGQVRAPCAPGTVFQGSTTIGDPAAVQGRDPAGLRYQVLATTAAPLDGLTVLLDVIAIDTGPETNLAVDTPITWTENVPITAQVDGTKVVDAAFRGGIGDETDAEYAKRLVLLRYRHKAGAGNRTEMIEWAFEAAQNAVGGAWVYGGAFHAGSAVVVVAQKRGSAAGPLARVPSAGTMALVTDYIASKTPVAPGPPALLALPVVAGSSDMFLSLAMAVESSAGWADPTPFPGLNGSDGCRISALVDQTHFTITTTLGLPTIGTPKMMVWDEDTSAFIQLTVSSVSLGSPNHFGVVLAAAPSGHTLAVGDVISPFTEQHRVIAQALTAYADTLGPGEIIDVSSGSSDDRRGYAFRWPKPNEQDPMVFGTGVIPYLQDALGAALANVTVEAVGVASPPVPADPVDGPFLIVLGGVGVYAPA